MAKWEAILNTRFRQIKTDTISSDGEMATLKQQIGKWADRNPDNEHVFPFGQFRGEGVRVKTKNGWITTVSHTT